MTCIVYKNYNIFVKYVLTNSIVKKYERQSESKFEA